MKKYLLFFLLFISIFSTSLFSEQINLDIENAVKLAMENNLNLKSSRIDLKMKKREADFSWNKFIPTIQASTTMMRWNTEQSGTALTGYGLTGSYAVPGVGTVYNEVLSVPYDLPGWGISAGLDISLTLNYSILKEIEGTKIDYNAGLISFDTAIKKLERDVRKNFYNILLFKENLNLMEQNIAAARDRFKQAEINYKNGLIPELSVLSAQVGYENMKPAFTQMKLSYATMLNSFKILLGLDLNTDLHITGDIEIEPIILNSEILTEKFLPHRMDILSINNTIQSLRNKKETLISKTMSPVLILGLNFDPAFSLDPFENNWFINMGDNWNQKSGMFRITMAMSLDSFLPGSPAKMGIINIEDGIAQAKLARAQIKTGAEMEIKTLVMQLNKSKEQLEILDLNISLAEKAYALSQEAYNAGSRELLEVEDSERDLNNAKLEVLKEKYNYITGLLDLEYALNRSLEEIKEAANE